MSFLEGMTVHISECFIVLKLCLLFCLQLTVDDNLCAQAHLGTHRVISPRLLGELPRLRALPAAQGQDGQLVLLVSTAPAPKRSKHGIRLWADAGHQAAEVGAREQGTHPVRSGAAQLALLRIQFQARTPLLPH